MFPHSEKECKKTSTESISFAITHIAQGETPRKKWRETPRNEFFREEPPTRLRSRSSKYRRIDDAEARRKSDQRSHVLVINFTKESTMRGGRGTSENARLTFFRRNPVKGSISRPTISCGDGEYIIDGGASLHVEWKIFADIRRIEDSHKLGHPFA